MKNKPMRVLLTLEFITLFILTPLLLFVIPTRTGLYVAVWGVGLYALIILRQHMSFHDMWHGKGWGARSQRVAFWRFVVLAVILGCGAYTFLPEKFMRFPLDRFPQWCLVMALYPVLSVIPQELFFRSFYFIRYEPVISDKWLTLLLNSFLFGFSHIVFHNWVAPALCFGGGLIFAHSYQQHRSLKWALIEHSVYGCWIFTLGIGWYFYAGNWLH